MRRWLLTYDIADDQRRAALAKRLSRSLSRVQESVFEGLASAGEIRQLLAEAAELLDLREDKLRAYPVSERNESRRTALGDAPRPAALADYWLI